MSIEEQLDALAAEWRIHCQRVSFSSNPAAYLNHPAFGQLVALGNAAVPEIMRRYSADEMPWEAVLERISGVNFQDDPAVFDGAVIHERRLKWWEGIITSTSGQIDHPSP